LTGLKQLHHLFVDDTGISDVGRAEFRKAVPGCKFAYDF